MVKTYNYSQGEVWQQKQVRHQSDIAYSDFLCLLFADSD